MESANSLVDALPSTFSQDPVKYFSNIAGQPPSREGLSQLAGPFAGWFSGLSTTDDIAVPAAAAYLQAAGIQLRDSASVAAIDAQEEAILTKQQYEVVTAAGLCASLCQSRRDLVVSSGILPTLAHLMLNSQTPNLTVVCVEFLQCALLAEHYRYANRLISGTWPRPDVTISVKHVLRYFYLRGLIHIGCGDFVQAHRCFWTCLSVPAEVCSTIMVEAWKKLVLVQCIMYDGVDIKPRGNDRSATTHASASTTTALPKCMPSCMAKMLASYKDTASSAPSEQINKKISGKRSQPSAGFFSQSSSSSGPQDPHRSTMSSLKSKEEVKPVTCYMEIAEMFYGRDKSRLQSLIAEYRSNIEDDGNMGLVEQCLSQLERNQVRHMGQMYSVISISKAASLLGISGRSIEPGVVHQKVSDLLCQSGVSCELQDDGMIAFHEDSDEIAVGVTGVGLREWMSLLERIQQLDVSIVTSPKYHSLLRKDVINSNAASSDGPRGVDDI